VATYFDQLYDHPQVILAHKTKIKTVYFILGPDGNSVCNQCV